ncbi:MAG: hypothetical protein AB7P23_04105 [Amphiplicatus sp.]
MIKPRGTILLTCIAGVLAAASGAARAEWTKTYAVDWNEPALYYGGKGGPGDPGTDCPDGVNPTPDWPLIMIKAGYEPAAAKWLFDPENTMTHRFLRLNQMAFRGKDRANVYADPTTGPDPGLTPVAGAIGEGIDLDDDASTGFTSPTGEKGIDNNFYRAVGCLKFYRSPPGKSGAAASGNDSAHAGVWTLVIVVSGKGEDPMNDDDVSLGVYLSSDTLAKNGAGEIARDYTFRIKPHWKYEALFKGKVAGGRITTEASPEVFVRDAAHGYGLELLQARADFEMQPGGGLKGYLGGYRPWKPVHAAFLTLVAANIEYSTGMDLSALWYALRRNADYSPAGAGGEKTHISYAVRIDAAPAYVSEPDGKTLVSSVKSYKSVAPEGEPLIHHPREAVRVRTVEGLAFTTVDGLALPVGETEVKPRTDEELRPPPAAQAEARTEGGAR